MKKTIKIALFFVFCIILSTTCVKAEGDEYRVTLSADKKTLKPGDEVTITIVIENKTITNGIYTLLSNIQLSKDVFEIKPIETSDLEGVQFQMLYDGREDEEILGVASPWGVIMMSDGENDLLMAQTLEEVAVKQGTSQVIGRVKLKVKTDAKPTTAKFNLLSKTAFDNLDAMDDTGDFDLEGGYTILDSEQDAVQLQIVSSTGDAGNTGNTGNTSNQTSKDDYQTIGNKQNNTQKQNKVQTENKATGSAPYTGIEDYIPFIFIGIIISGMAYINYQKYKNI